MKIIGIAACDAANAIGKGNQLIVRSREDLEFFKSKTKGQIVLMGRKTFESIGAKLEDRINIVLSTTLPLDAAGVIVCRNIPEVFTAINAMRSEKDLYIIGGAKIYELFMPLYDKFYLTHYECEVENSDTFLCNITEKENVPCKIENSLVLETLSQKKVAMSIYCLDYSKAIELEPQPEVDKKEETVNYSVFKKGISIKTEEGTFLFVDLPAGTTNAVDLWRIVNSPADLKTFIDRSIKVNSAVATSKWYGSQDNFSDVNVEIKVDLQPTITVN